MSTYQFLLQQLSQVVQFSQSTLKKVHAYNQLPVQQEKKTITAYCTAQNADFKITASHHYGGETFQSIFSRIG